MRIGFAFNKKPALVASSSPPSLPSPLDDRYAEWDDEDTIARVERALSAAGRVVRLEADVDFPLRLREARPDIVFNVAEGMDGPNREAHVPAICEFWSVPYTGSDPMTLSLCLDKGRAKEILAYHRIPTAAFAVVHGPDDLNGFAEWPAIVKPVHEGSSKGITTDSYCETRAHARDAIAAVVARYGQAALIERWLPGREFTCAILGNGARARTLPLVEVDFEALPPGARRLYSYEAKWIWDTPDRPLEIFHCPADVSRDLGRQVERTALAAYHALRCRDWARIDLRCDAQGVPHVLEVNPLPGILPDPAMNSCFPKAARAAGLDYDTMILAVLGAGAARHALKI
ncbi:MAG TPA: D-alanine--D-alanine ligase [Methylomirabilota bacterium]|nr:D-alanine--D-alanine ligase [Methylomirabilota bacterium]